MQGIKEPELWLHHGMQLCFFVVSRFHNDYKYKISYTEYVSEGYQCRQKKRRRKKKKAIFSSMQQVLSNARQQNMFAWKLILLGRFLQFITIFTLLEPSAERKN